MLCHMMPALCVSRSCCCLSLLHVDHAHCPCPHKQVNPLQWPLSTYRRVLDIAFSPGYAEAELRLALEVAAAEVPPTSRAHSLVRQQGQSTSSGKVPKLAGDENSAGEATTAGVSAGAAALELGVGGNSAIAKGEGRLMSGPLLVSCLSGARLAEMGGEELGAMLQELHLVVPGAQGAVDGADAGMDAAGGVPQRQQQRADAAPKQEGNQQPGQERLEEVSGHGSNNSGSDAASEASQEDPRPRPSLGDFMFDMLPPW
jgi:hypothetical protein